MRLIKTDQFNEQKISISISEKQSSKSDR
eukprot:UN11663